MMTLFDLLGWGEDSWSAQFIAGTVATLQISVGAFGAGLMIGASVAWAKLNGGRFAVTLANSYSTVCRAVPEVLLIIIFFYTGQSTVGELLAAIGLGDNVGISGFTAAIIVLGLVQGAYASEIIRGAVLAIPKGLIEAANAFGIGGFGLFYRIVLPAMLPHAVGGLANLWMVIIKDSALISVVGYNELLFTAKQAAGSTKHYFFFLFTAAALYYLITLVSNGLILLLERRIRRWMPRIS